MDYKPLEGNIRLLSLKGEPERDIVVKGRSGFNSVDWAADGKSLFVSSQSPTSSTLPRVDLEGHATPILAYDKYFGLRAKSQTCCWSTNPLERRAIQKLAAFSGFVPTNAHRDGYPLAAPFASGSQPVCRHIITYPAGGPVSGCRRLAQNLIVRCATSATGLGFDIRFLGI
jgi:hypothetical protein